jgi:hypothetical protein
MVGGTQNHGIRVGALGGFLWLVGHKTTEFVLGLWAVFCGWWDTQPRGKFTTSGKFEDFQEVSLMVGGTQNHGIRVGALGGFLWLVGHTTTGIVMGLYAAFCGWWDTQPRGKFTTSGKFEDFQEVSLMVGGIHNHGDLVGALGCFLWLVGHTTTG